MAAPGAPGAPVLERMTGEDGFWWSLEGPHSAMGMLALLRFGRRPRRQALREFFAALVASHRRFRQRLVTIDGLGYWEDVTRVARSRHLRRMPLDAADGAGEDERLHALLSRLAGTPLDPQRTCPGRLERNRLKASVEPMPSRISMPVSSFHWRQRASGKASPAE